MDVTSKAVWTLVLGAFLLLAAAGRLDLLVVLIPVAAVLAYAASRIFHEETGLKGGIK